MVSGYLEEWQLVALMNFRFKGRFRSEFVCVSKAVQVLLKFSGFKFEGKLQGMVHDEFLEVMKQDMFGILRSWFKFSESLSCRFSHRD